jgi:ribonuclease-3
LYPNESEGTLDKRFSKLVNKKTFYEISQKIKLKNFLFFGKSSKGGQPINKNIISDACEALIGAVFLDHGYDGAKEVILRLWKNHLFESNITIVDSKTKLQEYSLKKYQKLPIYKLENKTGPNHYPVFKISVKLDNSKKYYGIGLSKQDAEQKAADKILKNLD